MPFPLQFSSAVPGTALPAGAGGAQNFAGTVDPFGGTQSYSGGGGYGYTPPSVATIQAISDQLNAPRVGGGAFADAPIVQPPPPVAAPAAPLPITTQTAPVAPVAAPVAPAPAPVRPQAMPFQPYWGGGRDVTSMDQSRGGLMRFGQSSTMPGAAGGWGR